MGIKGVFQSRPASLSAMERPVLSILFLLGVLVVSAKVICLW